MFRSLSQYFTPPVEQGKAGGKFKVGGFRSPSLPAFTDNWLSATAPMSRNRERRPRKNKEFNAGMDRRLDFLIQLNRRTEHTIPR